MLLDVLSCPSCNGRRVAIDSVDEDSDWAMLECTCQRCKRSFGEDIALRDYDQVLRCGLEWLGMGVTVAQVVRAYRHFCTDWTPKRAREVSTWQPSNELNFTESQEMNHVQIGRQG